jgi:hypothetical protein
MSLAHATGGRVCSLMSKDRAIQLRDMALAIVQLDGVPLPLERGKVERPLGDRLIINVTAPTENTNTLTIWNGVEQVLCVGWSDELTRVVYYEGGDWERDLEVIAPNRARGTSGGPNCTA